MTDLLARATFVPSPDGFSKPCAVLNVVPMKSGYTRCTVHGIRDYAHRHRRSFGPSGMKVRQIACIHGHPFGASNTYIAPDSGTRKCRECRRITKRRAYARSIA